MTIPSDPKLLDAACDVTIRFRDHRSYGDEEGAIRRLRRRAPGHAPDEYRAIFRFFGEVYDRAVAAIGRHHVEKTTETVAFEDVDYAACLKEIDEVEPGAADREKRWILNWCIVWHYLK